MSFSAARGRVMRVVHAATGVVMVLATVSALVVVGGSLALRATHMQVAVVLSGSMTPQFVAGDAVLVKPAPKPSELAVGEVVTFHAPGASRLTTHRIHAVLHRADGVYIQTKGDANLTPDPDLTPAANVVGLETFVIPDGGRVLFLYTDPRWRLLTLGLPLLIMLVYQVGNVVRALRSDDDLDDDGEDGDHRDDGEDGDHRDDGETAHDGADTVTDERPHIGRRPAAVLALLARPTRRLAALGLAAAAAVGVAAGSTGATFTATSTTATSFTTAASFCSGTTAYESAVTADHPSVYWRQGSAAANPGGTYTGSVTMPVAGAMRCSDATTFTGTGALSADTSVKTPRTVTIETWFRSGGTGAAQIVGFGNRPASQGTSTSHDEVLYVDSNGRAAFAASGTSGAVTSPTTIVDGAWHYLVVTYSRRTATLYVDGREVARKGGLRTSSRFSGYWRAGTDTVAHLPGVSTSTDLTATLDDTAIYPTALTQAQVTAHYQAGIG